MILTRGTKPITLEKLDIPDNIPYKLTSTGNYQTIEINDTTQINRLKSKGFKQ